MKKEREERQKKPKIEIETKVKTPGIHLYASICVLLILGICTLVLSVFLTFISFVPLAFSIISLVLIFFLKRDYPSQKYRLNGILALGIIELILSALCALIFIITLVGQ